MSVQYLRLAADIQDELKDIARVVERAETSAIKAVKTGDDAYLDAVAINLHGFYSGAERLFENIARTVDGSLPDGDKWHHDLLRQMTLDIPAVRPPALRKETAYCLEEYLKFRHVVRNVYTFKFHPERLQALTKDLHPCFTAVQADLTHFAQFLIQLTNHDQ